MNAVMRARWEDVVRVVDQALDLELTGRPELLGRTCSGDSELRGEVDRLLDAAARQVPENPRHRRMRPSVQP